MAEPDDSPRLRLALDHHRAGRLQAAEALYRAILDGDPGCVAAVHHLGLIAHQRGHHTAAVELIRQAAAMAPLQPGIHSNLGEAYRHLQRYDEAIACFRQALVLQANRPDTLNNLGLAFAAQQKPDEAIACFRQALALQPNFGLAHCNLGTSLIAAGRHDEAVQHLRRATELFPESAELHCNLGGLLGRQGNLDEAIAGFHRAIALQPDLADAHHNLATALCDRGQLRAAIASYRQARSLAPNRPDFHSALIVAQLYDPASSVTEVATELGRWQQEHGQPLARFIRPPANRRLPDRPLRIGYVSPDFRHHAVAFFLLPLLENHDRSRFHVVCYPTSLGADAVTARISACAAEWRSLARSTDEEAAERIRGDQIDLLVDLSGHMAGNRLPLFARKPAPVQLTYLGFPGGTGLKAIDYRLTDLLADPKGAPSEDCAEKLVRLAETAWCFTPLSGSPPVARSPAMRHGRVTFGCFNNFSKVTDEMLGLCARLLQRVPGSRLTLKNLGVSAPTVVQRLEAFFAQQGVARERLQLIPAQASPLDHLRCYDEVDVALDTFPYHGTTTTCEALWMGVPVITLAGDRHLSRVGVSLLTNAGLPEFIAETPDAYVATAAAAAGDLSRLATLRTGLRERMQRSPLMDAPRFARAVEAAYREMWHRWCDQPASPNPAAG